jgi:hypothetical protein
VLCCAVLGCVCSMQMGVGRTLCVHAALLTAPSLPPPPPPPPHTHTTQFACPAFHPSPPGSLQTAARPHWTGPCGHHPVNTHCTHTAHQQQQAGRHHGRVRVAAAPMMQGQPPPGTPTPCASCARLCIHACMRVSTHHLTCPMPPPPSSPHPLPPSPGHTRWNQPPC